MAKDRSSRPRIVVLSAGLGVPSSSRMLADQLGSAVAAALAERGVTAQLDVVELREHAVDIANRMVSGYAGPALADVIRRVGEAEAVIAVTPTFSASYSGLFKSFIDILDPTFLEGMPVLFGATGGSSRHSLVLDLAIRPLFSYLRARTMPTAVYAAPEDWGAGEGGGGALDARIAQGAGELADVIAAGAADGGMPAPAAGSVSTGTHPGGAHPGTHPGGRPLGHRVRREAREVEQMSSLPFEELLAQVQNQ